MLPNPALVRTVCLRRSAAQLARWAYMNRAALVFAFLWIGFSEANAQTVSTSKFFLVIHLHCPEENVFCDDVSFELVRKKDCKIFHPEGWREIRYCAHTDTPCQDMGYSFQLQGISYRVSESIKVWATDRKGKEIWQEQGEFVATDTPNPSFQRIGESCALTVR
jgi:hypothetical protein